MSNLSTETVGKRSAYARAAFAEHFERDPDMTFTSDQHWIFGYVAALEDLPDEALASLGIL